MIKYPNKFMASKLNPYINFRGQTREALEFYKQALGGNVVMSTFGESGVPKETAEPDQIMHGQLETPSGFTLMISDAPQHMPVGEVGGNIQISLSGDDEDELRGYWDRLSQGANVTVPLAPAPWGDTFGMLTDKFGTGWMVNITSKKH